MRWFEKALATSGPNRYRCSSAGTSDSPGDSPILLGELATRDLPYDSFRAPERFALRGCCHPDPERQVLDATQPP